METRNITITCKVNLPTHHIGNIVSWILPDNTTRNISQTGEDDGTYTLYLPNTQAISDIGQYRCVARTYLQSEILEVRAAIHVDVIGNYEHFSL